MPDADDTSAALLALAAWHRRWPDRRAGEIKNAALAGMHWLLDLQNNDGGWPTFCRGWGKLPFDRSSTDITAHAVRALHAWSQRLRLPTNNAALSRRIGAATRLGLRFLEQQQQPNGSWNPLWFGNEQNTREANPVYGTAKVLQMYQALDRQGAEAARRGALWLSKAQHATGSWGAIPAAASHETPASCSVEETSLAISALQPYGTDSQQIASTVQLGLSWLVEAVEQGQHLEPAPIGFYFAKLWYHERLYPQIFAAQALAAACRAFPEKMLTAGAAQ